MIKLTLTKPVESFGKSVAELEFREPIVDDIIHCKSAYKLVPGEDGDENGIVPQTGAIARYISRLTGISSGAARSMSAADYVEAEQIVLGFFGPEVAEKAGTSRSTGSDSATTSQGTGA